MTIGQWELRRLGWVIERLKREALRGGLYDPPYTAEAYDNRHKQHGKVCVGWKHLTAEEIESCPVYKIPYAYNGYHQHVPQITALERIYRHLSEEVGRDD